MKKVVTLVLAIALVLTSVVALADGTPNINSFATLKVKYHELANEPWGAPAYWEITLSKPVDRLLINWSGKGEEPEELAVDENLKATALKGSHKYMPGTTQSRKPMPVAPDPTIAYDTVEKEWVFDVESSEWVYKVTKTTTGERDGAVNYVATTTMEQKWTYGPWKISDKDWEYEVERYKLEYPCDEYEIVKPAPVTKEVEEKDKFGNVSKKQVPVTDEDGHVLYKEGYIQGISVTVEQNTKVDLPTAPVVSTVSATPLQTAFMTVQGEWAVYYNRAGRIVGIEKFDGQF